MDFIQPTNLFQDAFIETFNGKLRNMCLNEHWFLPLQEAPFVIEAWPETIDEGWTHNTIGYVTA